jgi:hypothetical protein
MRVHVHAPQCLSKGGGTIITYFVVTQIQLLQGCVVPADMPMPCGTKQNAQGWTIAQHSETQNQNKDTPESNNERKWSIMALRTQSHKHQQNTKTGETQKSRNDEARHQQDARAAKKNRRRDRCGGHCFTMHAPQHLPDGGGTGVTDGVVSQPQPLKGCVVPADTPTPTE